MNVELRRYCVNRYGGTFILLLMNIGGTVVQSKRETFSRYKLVLYDKQILVLLSQRFDATARSNGGT